ncbi:MAG: hypothetical protein ABI193_07940 [Minicystis sp.]
MKRFILSFALVMLGAGSLLGACGGSGSSGTTGTSTITCDPGENIFCRCPGGEAGTKACKEDGHSFEACVTREGACPDIPQTTSSTTSSSGDGGQGGGSATGTSGAGGGALAPLYGACGKNEHCESGACKDGYCTKECAKFDECTLGMGECIQFEGSQFCMPVCGLTVDCDNAYGPPSACGYTKAVDGTPVTTCADWQEKLALPPDGSNCMGDLDCNLGHPGVQAVCSFETCTKGCYVPEDCPVNTTCSSTMGKLGSCN